MGCLRQLLKVRRGPAAYRGRRRAAGPEVRRVRVLLLRRPATVGRRLLDRGNQRARRHGHIAAAAAGGDGGYGGHGTVGGGRGGSRPANADVSGVSNGQDQDRGAAWRWWTRNLPRSGKRGRDATHALRRWRRLRRRRRQVLLVLLLSLTADQQRLLLPPLLLLCRVVRVDRGRMMVRTGMVRSAGTGRGEGGGGDGGAGCGARRRRRASRGRDDGTFPRRYRGRVSTTAADPPAGLSRRLRHHGGLRLFLGVVQPRSRSSSSGASDSGGAGGDGATRNCGRGSRGATDIIAGIIAVGAGGVAPHEHVFHGPHLVLVGQVFIVSFFSSYPVAPRRPRPRGGVRLVRKRAPVDPVNVWYCSAQLSGSILIANY